MDILNVAKGVELNANKNMIAYGKKKGWDLK